MSSTSDVETAILIIAPLEVQRVAYPLAKQYAARMLELYPVHFTLLWPFVAYDRLNEGCERLRRIASTLSPIQTTLDGYGTLGRSVYLKPVDPQPLIDLFRMIYQEFPECPPYFGRHGDVIHPHITVGLFNRSAQRDQAVFPPYDPITFSIDRLHVFYGPPQERIPWIVYDVVRLGSS